MTKVLQRRRGIFPQRQKYKHLLYIHKASNGYRITKKIGDKQLSFGTYKTIEEALQIRAQLIFHNWNPEYAGLKFKRRGGKNRFIYHLKNGYKIVKYNKSTGKQELYDTHIKTLEEARQLRDWWESVNWNWDAIEQ